jgi:hypothetical protein
MRDASVANLMRITNGVIAWDLSFIRSVQDWELESLVVFMDLMYSSIVRDSGDDKICWGPTKGA